MARLKTRSSHKKSHAKGSQIVGALKGAFFLLCLGLLVAFAIFGAKLLQPLGILPDVSVLERYEPIEAVQVFDRHDHLVCTVEGDEDRRVVPLNQVSTQMQQAILAAEDHHFFEHHGVNPVSIFRAFFVNLEAGHVVEGGSTITQQLVKNLFFEEPRRNFQRKIKEAIMAYELEQKYPKEKILELYLNQVYFGNGAYGIERAAYRYFDTSAAELNIAESAFLAGLVRAPSELSAPGNRHAAIVRQHEILDKMVEYGYITEGQGKAAKAQELPFKKGTNPLEKYPFYISQVLEILRGRFSQAEMSKQGLRVYTNLEPAAQEMAEQTLANGIKHAPKGVTQGALVSVNVSDGAVVALVGGVGNFWQNQWNRATNPHTCGSSFKPFVYLTAFRKGVLTPDSIIEDEPLVVKQPWGLPDYSPKNFDHKFLGKIPVRKALALSRNVCSVRIAQLCGIDSVVETARLAGITAKLDANLSLALGSSAVSPLEMAGAYATFARGGVAIRPQIIRRIEDNKGQVIEVFDAKVDKAFDAEPVALLISCMQDVVKFGTGTAARLSDRPVAGKTGTADEAKDIWFIGYTPDMVTAVWGGNDDNQAIAGSHVTGGDVMAKIWKDYMQAYYKKFPTPPGEFIKSTGQAVNAINGGQDGMPPTAPNVVPGAQGQVNPGQGGQTNPGDLNSAPNSGQVPGNANSGYTLPPPNLDNLQPPPAPREAPPAQPQPAKDDNNGLGKAEQTQLDRSN